MMKVFFVLICSLSFKLALAQSDALIIDEHNKYIYYQVSDVQGLSADTMYNRCLAGLAKAYYKTNIKPVTVPGKSVSIKSALVVYTEGGLARHEAGEVAYILTLDFKDNKYRLLLTDLTFFPYQRNRYGLYERVPGISMPIEGVKTKYNDKTFDSYANQIVKFGKQKSDDMKSFILNTPKSTIAPVKKNTQNW